MGRKRKAIPRKSTKILLWRTFCFLSSLYCLQGNENHYIWNSRRIIGAGVRLFHYFLSWNPRLPFSEIHCAYPFLLREKRMGIVSIFAPPLCYQYSHWIRSVLWQHLHNLRLKKSYRRIFSVSV